MTAARCRGRECDRFATAHVSATLEEQPARRLEFDACAEHALGALNLAPLLGLVVRVTDLPCAWCRQPLAGRRADRDEPLHEGHCAERYDRGRGLAQ